MKRKKKEFIINLILFLFMIIVCSLMIVPFLWMVSTSFKALGEVFEYPPRWIPKYFQLENYSRIWSLAPIGVYMLNSVIVSGGITVLHVFVACLSAYAFARLEFPGRDKLFLLFLATMMIPGQVTMIPNFILMKWLRWTDTYFGLIIPNVFTVFGVFLMRQFFMTIPRDYEDAARIDGATRFYILWRIIVPMAIPAVSTLAVLTFVFQWNNLLWPLIIVSRDKMKTITIGLASFQGMYGTTWNLLMAAATVGVIPSIVVFLVGQKYLIKGITMTGIKG